MIKKEADKYGAICLYSDIRKRLELGKAETTNQAEFENIINKYEDSFLFQKATILLSYIRNSKFGKFVNKLRKIVNGGEVFPQELYDKIKLSNSESDIYNIYGAMERTICVSVKKRVAWISP